MQPFFRFCYRFFAFAAVLLLAACFMGTPEQNEQRAEENGLSPVMIPKMEATNKTPPPRAPSIPEPYAPASHLAGELSPNNLPASAFAPPTRIGEAAEATTVKIGLLIPMSGASQNLGQSLLDAGVLAIYDKYGTLSPREITAAIELLPKDTGDSIEGAEKAAQDAIQEGATLILGPVFSKQVSAVAGIARHKNIPVISFSNNISVAGDNVYLFGFIPEQQVIRIVQYAVSQKIANIAALVPSNPYGAAIVKQLSTEVRKGGGRAHPLEYYQEDMSALQSNVGRLARFIEDQSTAKGQALFIAEGGSKLKTLTDTLAANGVNSGNVQLLGTGLWDDTSLLKLPTLRGGWFASSPPERYHTFEQHFVATYGYKPERLASLSYDAVALAATMAITSSGKGFSKELLTDPVGFNGPANGIFRFRPDGSIERGLSVLMVTPTGFKTIDPTPAQFNQ